MARLSSYAILSDPLPGGGYALLNGSTGAVDLLSDELGRIIGKVLSEKPHDKVYLPPDTIDFDTFNHLMDQGHITETSHETEREHVVRLADLLYDVAQENLYFVIIPSLECNYRCVYCFERPIQKDIDLREKGSSQHGKNITLTLDQLDAIFKTIEEIRSNAISLPTPQEREGTEKLFASKTPHIILYGGEPLSADNKDLVFEIVRRGSERGFCFVATSNGHDLDSFLPILGQGKIEEVQITFDGPRSVHDKLRISRKGDSSFDKLMSNIRLVLEMESPPEIQVRVHIHPSTINLFDELLQMFDQEGWLNRENVLIYLTNIYRKEASGQISPSLHYEDIIKRWHNALLNYNNVFMGVLSVHTQRLLLPRLERGKPCGLRGTYCGSNSGQYIFSPDGHIYACWESIGKEQSRIGTYAARNGVDFDKAKMEKWFSRSVARISECLDCPYCLLCGGGCAQYAEYNSGDIYKPFCDNFQDLYPQALALTVEKFLTSLEEPSNER